MEESFEYIMSNKIIGDGNVPPKTTSSAGPEIQGQLDDISQESS